MKTELKSLVISLLVFGTIISVSNVAKSDLVGQKIAVVDVAKVVTNSNQVKALKEEQTQKAQELTKWLEIVRADVAKQSNEVNKQKLTKKYEEELAKKREVNTQEYAKKLAEIDKSISATIEQQAKAKGYTLVIAKSSVLYGGDDITAEIAKVVK